MSIIDKFKEVTKALMDEHHGGVHLFAIMQMDDLVDKWSIILSASWADEQTYKDVFAEVRKLMLEKLSSEEVTMIARISVYLKTEHLIEELLKFREGHIIENQKINGNMIYKGYIIESNPDLVARSV